MAIQNRTLVAPVGSAGFNFNTEHDNSRLTNDGAAGVVASDGLTGHVKGDANLTGATIADLSGKGNLKVDGAVNAQNLKDYRDKDGGSGGLNVGISSTTLAPTVGVAFGRVAGEDYQAEQRATIDVGQTKDPRACRSAAASRVPSIRTPRRPRSFSATSTGPEAGRNSRWLASH